MSFSKKTIELVKATAPLVGENATKITGKFYPTLFKNAPAALHYFNKTNQNKGMQQQALAGAVVAYAQNIDNLGVLKTAVEKIAHRHVALSITPDLYPLVHDNLMIAIGDVLGEAVTPDIGAAWSEAIMGLAGICIEREEQLYTIAENRKGGWRQEREFELVSKVKKAEGTMSFNFAPTDGYSEGFEYETGQYLTIRVNGVAPRHYTITSKSGDRYLQCTTRLLEGGDVTNYMHKEMAVGDRCLLGAPSGIFVPNPSVTNAVLISAGIGVTPMYSFLNYFGPEGVKQVFHVDQCVERHAFKSEFENTGVNCKFVYTNESGIPDLALEAERLCREVGKEASYYICGPIPFMNEMEKQLKKCGASYVDSEKFGTG